MTDLHGSAIIIDGLVVARWNRGLFEAMRAGGLTAANCTCSIWEGTRDTMLAIAAWKARFRTDADLLLEVRTVADIRRAKQDGKVGIILGWQNTSGIEDRLDFIELFHDMGVRVMQLTYNAQNYVGSGCWEERDGGLSGFGRAAIAEMNRLGILIDLSHVGDRTAREAIEASRKPCAYSHVGLRSLLDNPRNKTDEQLRFLVERGGFVGFAPYPPILPKGAATTLEDCVIAIEAMIALCGEANVGIGTDFTNGHDEAFFDWLRTDKGHGRRMVPARGVAPGLDGLAGPADYPNLTRAMERRGWPEGRIRAVMGENWLRFLEQAWQPG